MNNTGAASGPAIPLVAPINHNHQQQQQQQQLNHIIVPIVTPPVPPPAPPPPNLPRSDLLYGPRADYINFGVPLYEAAIKGDWKAAKVILDKRPDLIHCALTDNYETVLHVASAAKRTKSVDDFVINLVNMMEKKDLELQNKNYNTALSLAAASGNIETAMAMVKKNHFLTEIPGNNRTMPLYMAAVFAKLDMVRYLYGISNKMGGDYWSTENRGWVLQKCVEGDIFDVALKILDDHPELTRKKGLLSDVLIALAQKPRAFEEIKPHIIFRIINSVFGVFKVKMGGEKESEALQLLRIVWKSVVLMPKYDIDDIIRGPSVTTSTKEGRTIKGYPSRVLFLAAKMGNTRFLVELIRSYPDIIWKQDDKGKTIFHLAIKHRHAKIYNWLYEIGAMRDLITPIKDIKGNNMLHMVAKKAKGNQFQNVAGVALQMQQELLWFKEVEQMIPPQYRRRKNRAGETPQDLFSRKHAALVTKGEGWMKNYMLVATLIATIVFAAAFTLPGGYNQNTGIPFFRNKPSLLVFVIADAVSLISSSASILIFLSMLTSSYAELDLLETLPEKLTFGLATLFLSIVSMMVAFSASFFVLYNGSLKWVPITITCLAAIPIILFAKLQFRFLGNVFYSAFRSRSLFKPNKPILYR
ncbi:putative ankyrin repeat-containing domain, PGG domain, ankyrin repeat-containing domain superfamily [Helianthus debilis subsp. tardiflorus]